MGTPSSAKSKLDRAWLINTRSVLRARIAFAQSATLARSHLDSRGRDSDLRSIWSRWTAPSYDELSHADWLPALRFAVGAVRPDGSDLSRDDQTVLSRIAEQLDIIAARDGLVAAAAAHDEIIQILASPEDATLH